MRESNRPEAAAATKAERQHKWYSLYDKVYNPGNLALAWELVRANKGAAGVDGESIEDFERELPENLQRLHEELRGKTYRPEPVRRVYIPKPDGRQRPLGIPAVRDRVVQQALRNKLEPIFEPEFLECSYGFRPGRSAHMALDQITAYLDEGYTWVVDLDLKSYFDTIPHDRLIDCVAAKVSDGSVLRLTRAMLEAGVMESGVVEDSETGTPQGGVISPLLANLYLHRFDMWATGRGYRLVRYADDMVILCGSQRAAERIMGHVTGFLEGELGLTVNQEKSRVVSLREGFAFLGYWFHPWGRRPSDKALEKFKQRVRQITRRNQTVDARLVIRDLNWYLTGWANYFCHGQVKGLFKTLDQWIRRRIRMVQMRSWRHPRKLLGMLRAKGWREEKLFRLGMCRWRNSKCQMVHAALDNAWLRSKGYRSLLDVYTKRMSPERG